MHSDQFKPKSYLKLNKKYVFSEGEQFPLTGRQKQCEVFRHESGGLAFFSFFFTKKNIYRVRAVAKNKWPKSEEKTEIGGTLGLAPA